MDSAPAVRYRYTPCSGRAGPADGIVVELTVGATVVDGVDVVVVERRYRLSAWSVVTARLWSWKTTWRTTTRAPATRTTAPATTQGHRRRPRPRPVSPARDLMLRNLPGA